ncbi:MAG TPA: hypothetical protein VKH45_10435 [Candidatus Acidoferrum sp.]|nr:hypothetical protein [Candidatus Acidoferrum sp.]
MKQRPISVGVALAIALILPVLGLSQSAAQSLTLDMNGQQAQLPVLQMNGRNYVEVEALARATSGAVSFQGNTMHLTLGGGAGNGGSSNSASSTPSQNAQPANPGFSKEFVRSGIEFMSSIREWRSVLSNGVANGYPIASLGLGYYQAQAQTNLRLSSTAIVTDSDSSVYALLNNEFANMKKLSDKYIAKAQNMNYIDPDSVKNDPLDQSVINCAHSLAAMASSGQFNDDGSCH